MHPADALLFGSTAASGDARTDFAPAATAVSDVLSAWSMTHDAEWPLDLGCDVLLHAAADIAALRLPDSGSSEALLAGAQGDEASLRTDLFSLGLESGLAGVSSTVPGDDATADLDAAVASTAADLAFLGFDPSDAALIAAYPECYSEDPGRDYFAAAAEAGSSFIADRQWQHDAAQSADYQHGTSEHAGSSTEEDRGQPGGTSSSGIPWRELLLSEPLRTDSAPASSSACSAAPAAGQLPGGGFRGSDAWSRSSYHGTWDGHPSSGLGTARRVPEPRAARSRALERGTASTRRQGRGEPQKQQPRGWDDTTAVPRPPSRHQELAALRREGEGARSGKGARPGSAQRAIQHLHAQASCTLADAWPLGSCRAAASLVSRSRPQTAVPRRRGADAEGKLLHIAYVLSAQ